MNRTFLGLALALLAGCAADVGVQSSPIVDGIAEPGRDEVVLLFNLRGSSCTASIISPYVVLTANHCVENGRGGPAAPQNLRVYVGASERRLTAEYRVSEVRPVPNAGLSGRQANDVALLVLSSPATQTPLELFRESPVGLRAQTVTSIGYGQTPTAGSGIKYRTTTRVQGYDGGFIFVEPSVCSGDSGGPLILSDGTVAGVASFIFSPDGRTRPTCGTAPGAYNEIFRHLDFIDSVLEETGSCVPSASEICNGEDDNCDGVVDEGCIPLGDPCTNSDECVGALCAETTMGRICTSQCDMLRPTEGCGPGFYCSDSGCDGFCVPGGAGDRSIGEDCTSDTECFSLHCRDPGDGRARCLDPCQHDAGLCLGGEVCATAPGACGSCVPQELFAERGLGEPCETDLQCGDGRSCVVNAGIGECAAPCGADDACPDLFACREGQCIRDRTQGVGGVCDVNDDCGDAVCARAGDRAWCTVECTSADECPDGFNCAPAGAVSVCAPATSLDGEACTDNAECASGVCARTGTGGFCTRPCDGRNACAPGFECTRIGGPQAVCVERVVEALDEGCAVTPGRVSGAPLVLGLFGLGLLVAVRRRFS